MSRIQFHLNKYGLSSVFWGALEHPWPNRIFLTPKNIDFLLKNVIFDRLNFLEHFFKENKVKIYKSMIFLFKLYFYVKIDDLELNKKATSLIMCSSIQHTLFYISRNIDFLLKNAIFDRLNFLVHFLQENKVKICKSMIFFSKIILLCKKLMFLES